MTTREDPLRQSFGIALEPLPFGFAMVFFSVLVTRDTRCSLLCLRYINTIILGDELDGLWGEFTGKGADAHCGENGSTCGEVTPECSV